jgi:hypothetical protein
LFKEARRKAGFCFSGLREVARTPNCLDEQQQRSNNKKAPAEAGAFAFNDAPKDTSTHQNVTLQLLI